MFPGLLVPFGILSLRVCIIFRREEYEDTRQSAGISLVLDVTTLTRRAS